MKNDKWIHTHDPIVWEERANAWDKMVEVQTFDTIGDMFAAIRRGRDCETECKMFADLSRSQAQRLRDGHACRLCEVLGKCEKCTK